MDRENNNQCRAMVGTRTTRYKEQRLSTLIREQARIVKFWPEL